MDALEQGNQNISGQPNENVGQDVSGKQQEDSNWEEQAKYFQSEKDKLYAENENLKKYEKIGKFLESRPDIVEKISDNVAGNSQPEQERIVLDKDEFDPWEAYNDPASKSYKFRQQELQDSIDTAVKQNVSQQVSGIQEQVGMNQLNQELAKRGLNDEQIQSFVEFAKKPTSEYGLDGAIKMWQSMTGQSEQVQPAEVNPFDMVRQSQGNPPQGGVLNGQQPERKNDKDSMWEAITKAGSRANVL